MALQCNEDIPPVTTMPLKQRRCNEMGQLSVHVVSSSERFRGIVFYRVESISLIQWRNLI